MHQQNKFTLTATLFILFAQLTFAQTDVDIKDVKVKNDSTTEVFLYRITTMSGNNIVGEILKTTADSVTVSSSDIGVVKLSLKQIDTIEIYDAKKDSSRRKMVGVNHYLIAPSTPYGLDKGEINLQNSEIFLMSAWFGLSDNFTLGGGFSIIPFVDFSDQLFYIVPKFNFPITPKLNASIQYTQFISSGIDNTSLLSFSAAFGESDKHVSFGYTTPVFADGEDVAFEAALYNIGAVLRTGNKFAFLLDFNIPSVSTDDGLYGFGGRYIGRSSSFDFGFLTVSGSDGFPFPWFNYTLRLK